MSAELSAVPERQLAAPMTSSLAILEAAVAGGVTSENVAVVKEIIAMRREEMALENKAAFNRAFFALKREIAGMDFFCDKEAKTKSGDVAYTYCSEAEIAGKLEPVLFRHGFAMLFGQRQEGDRVVAIVTLIHESGHEETREYSVRVGSSNSMKDNTAVDAGSTTSAWRHLVMKMFGLKSRIREADDARNLGGVISAAKAAELRRRAQACGADEAAFLKLACAAAYEEILEGKLSVLEPKLAKKEAQMGAPKKAAPIAKPEDPDIDWNANS